MSPNATSPPPVFRCSTGLSTQSTGDGAPSLPKFSLARRVEVSPLDRLRNDELIAWENLRDSRPEYASPFFSTRFSEAVHAARGDVWIAVIMDGDEIVGFFPFHRFRGTAVPVGRFLNDAHNIIADPATMIDWIWLLEKIDCKAFDFHAMAGGDNESIFQFAQGTLQSFHANIGDDSLGFLQQLERSHKTIERQSHLTRKLSRQVGKVRLQTDCSDPMLLQRAIDWMRNQYRRTHTLDLFSADWTGDLIRHLHRENTQTPNHLPARGLFSVLYAGDHPVAAHFGIMQRGLLHYWFPTCDTAYAEYCVETALFVELIRNATQHGIHCVDLGYGEQPCKRGQSDSTGEVAYGCISRSRFHQNRRKLETLAVSTMKKMPLKVAAKKIWRRLQPNAGISKLR